MGRNLEKSSAFTLAEVLITLGIIGIIAAITLPIVTNKVRESIWKNAYKKCFSVLSQSFQELSGSNELYSYNTDTSAHRKNFALLKSKFKVSKDCNDSNNAECWDRTELWSNNNCPSTTAPSFIDVSGAAYSLRFGNTNQYNNYILIDTNGFKSPNQYGRDRMVIWWLDTNNTATDYPVKLRPVSDYAIPAGSSPDCPQGYCYFTKWLYE